VFWKEWSDIRNGRKVSLAGNDKLTVDYMNHTLLATKNDSLYHHSCDIPFDLEHSTPGRFNHVLNIA